MQLTTSAVIFPNVLYCVICRFNLTENARVYKQKLNNFTRPSLLPPLSTDASELSDKHSDSTTVQVKVTRPRQLWQPLSSWKRRNKVVPSPQAKKKVSPATTPLSSSETLSDKENLGPSPPPPPPPPLHPLRRKMEKLNITSSEDLLSTFTPVSPLYKQPEGERERERERERGRGRERGREGGRERERERGVCIRELPIENNSL